MGTSSSMAGIGKVKNVGHSQGGFQLGWWKNKEFLQQLLLCSQLIKKTWSSTSERSGRNVRYLRRKGKT